MVQCSVVMFMVQCSVVMFWGPVDKYNGLLVCRCIY